MGVERGFSRHGIMEATNAALGAGGFLRIVPGDGTVTGQFIAVKAIGSTPAVFNTGTTVSHGSAPTSGDRVNEGDVVFAPFTAINISAGVVYAYYLEIAV